jgi:hypothetical protein
VVFMVVSLFGHLTIAPETEHRDEMPLTLWLIAPAAAGGACGESNLRTMELVRNWCAHVQVQKHGVVGIAEQQISLPIGHHALTCPHAAAAGFATRDRADAALDFYDRNCVACRDRKPVTLPNISILVQKRDAARAAAAAEEAHFESERSARQAARDATRQLIRADLEPPSADVVDQLEELDHQWNETVVTGLVQTAGLAPEVFAPPLWEYAFGLLERGEFWFDAAGLRLLKALQADAARLTRCAPPCLYRHSSPAYGVIVN